jgi:hypothetical protein
MQQRSTGMQILDRPREEGEDISIDLASHHEVLPPGFQEHRRQTS